MMKGFSAAKPIVVEGSWNGAGVTLWTEDAGELEARLRDLLFAWHEPSWFGSDIEYTDAEEPGKGRKMLIEPLLALDYLCSPQPVRMLAVEWAESAAKLLNGAQRIMNALTQGSFEPDWSGWKDGDRKWRFKDAASDTDLWMNEWLSASLEALLAANADIRAAWSALERSIGPALERRLPDEEDWYIGIGLKQDTFPFRIALQLAEPDESGVWSLRAALRGRSGEDGWIPLDRGSRPGSWRPAAGSVLRLPEDWLPLLEERLEREERKWKQALPDWVEPDGETVKRQLADEEAWLFLEQASLKLLDAGAIVLLPGWWENVRKRRVRLKAKLRSAAGSAEQPMFGLSQIVQFDWKLALGGADLTEEEFMQLAAQNKRLIKIDGEWVHLHPEDISRIKSWMKKNGGRKGLSFQEIMQMHLQGGITLSDEAEDGEELLKAEVELNGHLQQLMNQLQNTAELPLVQVPSTFRGELRPYQLQGVSWLAFLRRFGLGATLADDMGLGKTIQFTVYLLFIKEAGGISEGQPSLLVCPTSVIGNWEKELQRFAPGLDVRLHYGPRRARGEKAFREFAEGADLIITSYALAALDEEELGALEWESLCLDEAQNIKNIYTKQSSAIRNLRSRHRIALTGTPMENRLSELWSIYDFTNPGYLGTLPEFRRAVILPIEKERNTDKIASLQRRIKPFMLRRLKKDPAIQLSLPEKNEGQVYVTLTAEQGALYEGIVSDLLEKLDTLGPMQRRGLILASITRLKQVCDHPALLLGEERESGLWTPDRSAKLLRLLEMCEEIAAEGERALIFTQFVDMGKALQTALAEKMGLPVPYLHGGVPKAKRDEMIAAFQDPGQPHGAFVLSLKAGGTGLNLTEANHVFHFDRWWNPAVENQATDRAFRIGQRRQVQVHKFVTLGTLEERIHEMIERKQSLNDQVVSQTEQWITELSNDELREIFTLRREWLDS